MNLDDELAELRRLKAAADAKDRARDEAEARREQAARDSRNGGR